jgi:hypothetical protein
VTTSQTTSEATGRGVAYCDGYDGVEAFIGKNGRFLLDTSKSALRLGIVNFPGCGQLVSMTGADCLTDIGLNTNGEWMAIGVPLGDELDLWTIAEGGSALGDFQIAFPSGVSKNVPHLLIFGGSNFGANACGSPLTITRVANDTWTVTATGDTACLLEVVAKNGKRQITDSFSLTFEVTIVLL